MDLIAKELQKPNYGEQNTSANKVARGANGFAFRLSAALLENSSSENFVCSPFSVWLPLAALVNATDNHNKQKLLAVLNAEGISEENINNAASRLLYDLKNENYRRYAEMYDEPYYDQMKITNALFVDKDITVRREFEQTFLDCYCGHTMNVDFSSDEAIKAINEWVRENTENLISEIVQGFDSETIVSMANAIYYSGRWIWEFEHGQTKKDVFYSPKGEASAFFMLREGDEQEYYEDDSIQAMPLKYMNGGGMYIILPKQEDAEEILKAMTSERFIDIQKNTIKATGKLLLPRFSIESDLLDLGGTLTTIGVPLFDEIAAPLTGGLIEENKPVWLSGATHKAVIKVTELGTTAAAISLLAICAGGMPEIIPTEPFEMICNKPFAFLLYEHTHDGGNQVLFTGIVNRPY